MIRSFAALGAAVFLLLALELAARFYFSVHQDYETEVWRYSRLLWKNVPDARGHVQQPNQSAVLMGVTVTTNSLGLRGAEPGELGGGLLVAGDGATLGWGVEEAETFTARLGAACPGKRPVNLGVVNYNLEQVVASLKDLLPRLRGRQLLYAFAPNDALPPQRDPGRSWISRHSYLALSLRKTSARLLGLAPQPQRRIAALYSSFQGESWDKFSAAAKELVTLSRRRRLQLRVVLLPDLRSPGDPEIAEIYSKAEALFRSLGARTLNLYGKLPPAASPKELWVAGDDPHPNPEAHRAIASALAKAFWPGCNPP